MRQSMSVRNSPPLGRDLFRLVPSARFGGVYVQTCGPRIETVAEVNALAQVADVVGMTVASEATLACELGMEFAALCTLIITQTGWVARCSPTSISSPPQKNIAHGQKRYWKRSSGTWADADGNDGYF